ncbi:hypothetical protein ZHAS_00010987 [Anopheles sinensis]|uniref:Uncharacterized protein n=1 Tax=Anopheles sinensis TaxID=74873 RepID=A0A084VYY6_ANOSI|nr:hypothetical protein ZHAS_00010987 [Anopheles sinensis]
MGWFLWLNENVWGVYFACVVFNVFQVRLTLVVTLIGSRFSIDSDREIITLMDGLVDGRMKGDEVQHGKREIKVKRCNECTRGEGG